jgi:hypothetical protein
MDADSSRRAVAYEGDAMLASIMQPPTATPSWKEENGVVDLGAGMASLDGTNWVGGQQVLTVTDNTAETIAMVTVTDAGDSTLTGSSGSLTWVPAMLNSFVIVPDSSVQYVGEPFKVFVSPVDKYGNISLSQGCPPLGGWYSFVWVAFSANKLAVEVPGPPQRQFASVDTFGVTANQPTNNLQLTVRLTDALGNVVTAPGAPYGITSNIRVMERPEVFRPDPPKVVRAEPLSANWDSVRVSGWALGADLVIAYMEDITGAIGRVAGSDTVQTAAGYFEIYVDASTLLDGRVRFTAVTVKSDTVMGDLYSEEYTLCCEGAWPEVLKDTSPLLGPTHLSVRDWKGPDQAGDEGGFVLATFDPPPADQPVDRFRMYRRVELGDYTYARVEFGLHAEYYDSLICIIVPERQDTTCFEMQVPRWIEDLFLVDMQTGDTLNIPVPPGSQVGDIVTLGTPESAWISWAVIPAYDPRIVEGIDEDSIRVVLSTLGDTVVTEWGVVAETCTCDRPMDASDAITTWGQAVVGKVNPMALDRKQIADLLKASEMVTAWGGATDEIAPEPATNVMAADALEDAGILVTWDLSPSDKFVSYDFDGHPYMRGVTQYKVYRKADFEEEFSLVKDGIPYGTSSYTDPLNSGTKYQYRVIASDGTPDHDAWSDASNLMFGVIDAEAARGNFNSDDTIDFQDFFLLARSYGAQEGEPEYFSAFDIADPRGSIGLDDLLLFAKYFTEEGSSLAKMVPTQMGTNLETVLDMAVLNDVLEEFTVRVALDKATDLAGYGFTVRYDPSVFEFDRASTDVNILTSSGAVTAPMLVIPTKPGELAVANAIRSGETVAGEGLAADLTFKLKDKMGGNIRVIRAEAADRYSRTNPIRLRSASVAAKPKVFALKQNYPNPFNPVTTIEYALPEAASVRLEVYNTLGQVVATLVEKPQVAGRYTVRWDGLNSNREMVGSGVYFYRMVADDFQDIKRMLLIK